MCCPRCPLSPASNALPLALWLSLLLPAWALSRATATVWTLSAAAMRSSCATPSSPLLRLHAQTLRLNPYAGLPRPRGWLRPHLHLVQPDERGS